jgi:hypothetical protein
MNEQENITLIKQCYDNFLKGDIQQLLSALSDDINWELPAMEDVSFSGKRHGRDQVKEFFKSLSESKARSYLSQKSSLPKATRWWC